MLDVNIRANKHTVEQTFKMHNFEIRKNVRPVKHMYI